MEKAYVFYNPLADGGKVLEDLDVLAFVLDAEVVLCDMTKPETYEETLFSLGDGDVLIVCGGDGTLNRFVNLISQLVLPVPLAYYPAGQNNDFARDHLRVYGCNPFAVDRKLSRLPALRLDQRQGYFLTASVFSAWSEKRRHSRKHPAYTNQKPASVMVILDGQQTRYAQVSFAAVLYGRHTLGGLTPDPGRKAGEAQLSLVLIRDCGRGKTRRILKQLRKGKVPKSSCYLCRKGSTVTLDFEAPVTLCADGEIQTGVTHMAAAAAEEGSV